MLSVGRPAELGPDQEGSVTDHTFSHLYEIVRDRAVRLPDAPAVGGQDGLAWQTLDGRALLAAVDAVAAELARRGVREGDRVVLWLPNGWLAPVYYWATWKLGAVAV